MNRTEFIQTQAASLQVAAYPWGLANAPTNHAKSLAVACMNNATALADALGIPATTTPSDCYAIPKAVADAWVGWWHPCPPNTPAHLNLYNAILAQRKESK